MENKLKIKINRAYYAMKDRCYNPKYNKYKNYGGRGIKVCDEWLRDKKAFIEWAINNSVDLTLTLDRIDVNKDYSPENCRWVSMKQQQNNKRNNIKVRYNGEVLSIEELQNRYNIKYKTIYARLKNYKYDENSVIDFPLNFKRGYIPKTKEHYIYYMKGKYSVQIHKKYYGIYNTIEEAICKRDKVLEYNKGEHNER